MTDVWVAFLTARLDEDAAQYQRGAADDPDAYGGDLNERYIIAEARRMLREIEAKRAIVARCQAVLESFADPEHGSWPDVSRRERSHAHADLADLAAVYSGRPDYPGGEGLGRGRLSGEEHGHLIG